MVVSGLFLMLNYDFMCFLFRFFEKLPAVGLRLVSLSGVLAVGVLACWPWVWCVVGSRSDVWKRPAVLPAGVAV